MTYHVTPVNDTIPHEETITCECCPEVEFLENGDMLVVHNAHDGRE